MKTNLKILYFLLALFTILLCYDYADRIVLGVADDTTHISTLINYQKGNLTTYELFKQYLSEPTRQQRPFSGFFIAAHTFLGQQSVFMFYFIRFVYVFVFMASFRMLLKRETKNEYIIFTTLFLSSIYPLAAGVYFVAIMWQMYWVLTIYFAHLYLLYNKSLISYFFSGLFFSIGLLFNEYVVFLAPFVLYLIFIRIPSDKKTSKFLLAFLLPFVAIFIYRYFLVDLIYGNTYKFDESTFALTKDNFIRFLATTAKFLSVYSLNLLKNSFVNIQFYTFLDYILLLIVAAITAIILKSDFITKKYKITKEDVFLVILLFFLTFSFCAFTFYKPYILGFNTRIFCLGLFVFPIMTIVFILYFKNILIRKILISVIIIISSITIISQKNGWIFASQLNEKIVKDPILQKIDFSKSKTILIACDLHRYKEFVIAEPSLSHIVVAFSIFKNTSNLIVDEIILSPQRGKFMNFEYDHYPQNFYFINENTIRIRNRKFNYPFYIYNYDAKTVDLIKNKPELQKYQQNYLKK